MDAQHMTKAVLAVGDVLRQHTQETNEAISILCAALAFEACSAKTAESSHDDLEQWLLGMVRYNLALSRKAISNNQPAG